MESYTNTIEEGNIEIREKSLLNVLDAEAAKTEVIITKIEDINKKKLARNDRIIELNKKINKTTREIEELKNIAKSFAIEESVEEPINYDEFKNDYETNIDTFNSMNKRYKKEKLMYSEEIKKAKKKLKELNKVNYLY